MENKKALLIKSNKGVASNLTNQWEPLATATSFIDNIDTSDSNKNASAEKFNLLISGVPSPWARVKLTSYALSKNIDEDDNRTLMLCYKYMKEEWRGLMAAYALKPDRFVLSDPIPLISTPIGDRRGKFDIISTYAEMLFDDAPLWKYKFGKNDNPPYIQLLYYKEKTELDKNENRVLVGATSPFTIFFTSANYSLKKSRSEIPWIAESGKFSDPASIENEKKIDEKDLLKLYSFLCNIDKRRKKYQEELLQICGDDKIEEIESIKDCLMNEIDAWKKEIRMALHKGENEISEVPVIIKDKIKPTGPLRALLTTEYCYYWKSGAFYTTSQGEDTITIDQVGKLFIEGNVIVGWKGSADANRDYSNAPVYYLTAKDELNDIYYFALPFSRFALQFLDIALDQIIAGKNEKVKYKAVKRGNKLVVILSALINNEEVDILNREFDIVEPESNGKVFVWPNFASPLWKNYYYYSEYPSNDVGVRIIPEFENLKFEELLNDKEKKTELDKYFLVRYPVNQVSTNKHRYEVIKTEEPVRSLAVKVKQDETESLGGYLILKKEASGMNSCFLKTMGKDMAPRSSATIGIDFGSTNSCVYYKVAGEDAKPVPFENRRLALVGFDNPARAQANKDELYFISNEEPINNNGQIKSWLHEHDPLYVDESKVDNEIVGGVPVNEANIIVHSMNENVIMTNAGILNYNMKWLSDNAGEKKKEAFMKMIWIQICADLFAKGIKPEVLRWSFPSAMGRTDISKLRNLYKKLKTTPIEGVSLKEPQSFTEAEAVCSYALSKQEALAENKLFLGIDIGGSTSDILVLGRGADPVKGMVNKLYSQCSIRMAAGFFFKAINSSGKFRKSLYNFHNSQRTSVKVLHIDDVISNDAEVYKRSPYYLNNIFDQLKGEKEFVDFYSYLQKDVPFVFSLPAYVTGMLVFYAGMLMRGIIDKHHLEAVNEIHLRYYGKGGRLFEWLFDIYEDETKSFLRKCLKAGLQKDNMKIVYDNLESRDFEGDSKIENKSEVAKGLVDMTSEIDGVYDHGEDEDEKVRSGSHFEVLGEKGISYFKEGKEVLLDEQDLIEDNLFENVLNFKFPAQFENFGKFIDLFVDFISNEIGVIDDAEDLKKGKNRVSNVAAFITNDPEYIKYRQCTDKSKASYRMPIVIASALYYLDNVLLPAIFKREN